LYHKNTTHTTLRREKFDKKRPPLGGFWGISIYSTVKDPGNRGAAMKQRAHKTAIEKSAQK
jgi:hypothetical protein